MFLNFKHLFIYVFLVLSWQKCACFECYFVLEFAINTVSSKAWIWWAVTFLTANEQGYIPPSAAPANRLLLLPWRCQKIHSFLPAVSHRHCAFCDCGFVHFVQADRDDAQSHLGCLYLSMLFCCINVFRLCVMIMEAATDAAALVAPS